MVDAPVPLQVTLEVCLANCAHCQSAKEAFKKLGERIALTINPTDLSLCPVVKVGPYEATGRSAITVLMKHHGF